jgi:hypothetical protein
MTLAEITKDYTTTQNGITHNFKVGERYEIFVPMGADYVEAKKTANTVGGVTGKDVQLTTLVKIPNGYWQPTTSGVYVPPSSSTQTSSTETNASSKVDANVKYIFLGVLLVGAVSYLVMKNKK